MEGNRGHQGRGLERGQPFSGLIPTPRMVIVKGDRPGQLKDLGRLNEHYRFEIETAEKQLAEGNQWLQQISQEIAVAENNLIDVQEQVIHGLRNLQALEDQPELHLQAEQQLQRLRDAEHKARASFSRLQVGRDSKQETMARQQIMVDRKKQLTDVNNKNMVYLIKIINLMNMECRIY